MAKKQRKEQQVGVRLTDEAMKRLEKLAEVRHTDKSELVRQLIYRELDAAE